MWSVCTELCSSLIDQLCDSVEQIAARVIGVHYELVPIAFNRYLILFADELVQITPLFV